jgi:hypothetical protein
VTVCARHNVGAHLCQTRHSSLPRAAHFPSALLHKYSTPPRTQTRNPLSTAQDVSKMPRTVAGGCRSQPSCGTKIRILPLLCKCSHFLARSCASLDQEDSRQNFHDVEHATPHPAAQDGSDPTAVEPEEERAETTNSCQPWSNILSEHRLDLAQLFSTQNCPQPDEGVLRMPFIIVSDCADAQIFLLLLNAQGRSPPHMFLHADRMAVLPALRSGRLKGTEVLQHLMKFHGANPKQYATVVLGFSLS